jgi:hypothetical protein
VNNIYFTYFNYFSAARQINMVFPTFIVSLFIIVFSILVETIIISVVELLNEDKSLTPSDLLRWSFENFPAS